MVETSNKMIKKSFLRYTILVIIISLSYAISLAKGNEYPKIQIYEDSLSNYFSKMASCTEDNERIRLNDSIIRIFKKILPNEKTIDYPFDSINYLGVLQSEDEKLKIYNWNVPFNDGTNKYFGFIQYYSKKEKKYYLHELFDNSDKIKNPELVVLSNKNWYGALYYSIIENKCHGNVYYTLLGTDFNNMFTTKKIIDVLSFDNNSEVIFGAPIFKNRKRKINRVIFEYSARTTMGLHFDNKKGMIVYDHLSPIRPSLKGQFEFYGPDFSYDGLKFERGIWNSYYDLDVRNLDVE